MNEVIVAKNLVKEYGENNQIKALDDVSISICQGDFVGIMGPSGSGKSTFLNMIGTVDKPTKGSVMVGGKEVILMGEREIAKFRYENVGFIFQEFNLIDSLTLRENIGIPLALAGKSKIEIKERVEKIAEKLNLTEYLYKFPSECSGGQRQRAASARALVADPKIVVADEPTGNLDTKNSHELLQFLQGLNETEGVTILMVTHDSMIASYTKKLVFLRDGKIEEVLEKGEKDQQQFFYDIVEVTSRETQNLLNVMVK